MKIQAKKKANIINTDYKATSIAADLVHYGLDPNQIEILPVGGSKRAFSKEIESVYNYISETSGQQYTRIEINREGLYDMLPEGLFHTLATGTEVLDEDIMIEDIRNKRKEEKDARTFFAPFEIEISQIKMLLEIYENRLDMQTSFSEMGNLLTRSWEELKLLNNKQRVIWMHFIPEIQYRKNDLNYLQHFLTTLTNLPITVSKKTISKHNAWEDSTDNSFSLGNTSLGVDSVTKFIEKENINIIEIKIGPTYPQLIKSYLPNESKETIIKMTTDYLLPIDIEVQITYDLIAEKKFSELSNHPNQTTTILGHTSYL